MWPRVERVRERNPRGTRMSGSPPRGQGAEVSRDPPPPPTANAPPANPWTASDLDDPHGAPDKPERVRRMFGAIARAYDFPAFVGVSDWAHPVDFRGSKSSGAAGLAHPNPARSAQLFRPLGSRRAMAFELDLESLRHLRVNRRARGLADLGADESMTSTTR